MATYSLSGQLDNTQVDPYAAIADSQEPWDAHSPQEELIPHFKWLITKDKTSDKESTYAREKAQVAGLHPEARLTPEFLAGSKQRAETGEGPNFRELAFQMVGTNEGYVDKPTEDTVATGGGNFSGIGIHGSSKIYNTFEEAVVDYVDVLKTMEGRARMSISRDPHPKTLEGQGFGEKFDELDPFTQAFVIDSYYRGDMRGSDNARGLMLDGRWAAAAVEYLNNSNYRKSQVTGSGIAPRMRRFARHMINLPLKEVGTVRETGRKLFERAIPNKHWDPDNPSASPEFLVERISEITESFPMITNEWGGVGAWKTYPTVDPETGLTPRDNGGWTWEEAEQYADENGLSFIANTEEEAAYNSKKRSNRLRKDLDLLYPAAAGGMAYRGPGDLDFPENVEEIFEHRPKPGVKPRMDAGETKVRLLADSFGHIVEAHQDVPAEIIMEVQAEKLNPEKFDKKFSDLGIDEKPGAPKKIRYSLTNKSSGKTWLKMSEENILFLEKMRVPGNFRTKLYTKKETSKLLARANYHRDLFDDAGGWIKGFDRHHQRTWDTTPLSLKKVHQVEQQLIDMGRDELPKFIRHLRGRGGRLAAEEMERILEEGGPIGRFLEDKLELYGSPPIDPNSPDFDPVKANRILSFMEDPLGTAEDWGKGGVISQMEKQHEERSKKKAHRSKLRRIAQVRSFVRGIPEFLGGPLGISFELVMAFGPGGTFDPRRNKLHAEMDDLLRKEALIYSQELFEKRKPGQSRELQRQSLRF